MKKLKRILVIALLIASKMLYGDVIPENSSYVGVCVQITNINDYQGVSLIGFTSASVILNNTSAYSINSNVCLIGVPRWSNLSIYAVKSSYISGKVLSSIDWTKDKNAIKTNISNFLSSGYMYNMSTVDSIKQYYKIAGFTDTSVVLYEWKEVTKYNNGQADNVVLKSYQGDASILSQEITSVSQITNEKASFVLSPNPTSKNLHLKISNSYYGNISVKITSTEGKVVKTSNVIKDTSYLDFLLYVDTLKKGNYIVTIIMGEAIESRRLSVL